MENTKYLYVTISVLVASVVILVLLSLALFKQKPIPEQNTSSYWVPKIGDSFQWQLVEYPINLSIDTDIYDLDLFETPNSTIKELHANGKKVICYVNVGAWEEYRDDAMAFPKSSIGNDYEGWEGEKWLDIGSYLDFSGIMEKRFDLAQDKGCDAIEPDNIENHNEETGFELSYDQQLEYNIWIADQVHSRNMSIGLKNNPDQINDLIEYYDWALIEDCTEWDFCGEYETFINTGKAVFQVEYTDSAMTLEKFCASSIENDFYGILKNRELDDWVSVCKN